MMLSDGSGAGFTAESFRSASLALVQAYRLAGTEARWTPTSPVFFGFGESNAMVSGYLSTQRAFSISEELQLRNVTIDYHIIFSDSWQVPVLYFSPIWDDAQEPLSLEEVYTFVVETNSKEALRDIGVLGGISHGVHFVTFNGF